MKTIFKNPFLLPALAAGLGLAAVDRATAQTFKTLYNFAQESGDGADPQGGLVVSGNTLYGTTSGGGSAYSGTIFKVNTDGTGYQTLYSFTATSSFKNTDGAYPSAGLILSGNILYGTAPDGGSLGFGTVFAVTTNGTGFTTLHNFNDTSDGSEPLAGLILSGTNLYGTAQGGGADGAGTVFVIGTNGAGFKVLHSFVGADGAFPDGGLVLSSNTLYGITTASGGTIFKVATNGTGFATLYTFAPLANGKNNGGSSPQDGLILSGNRLYGTADLGGTAGDGTVFAINTNGGGFTTLYNFAHGSDGSSPLGGLLLLGQTLYGTTQVGGNPGNGTLFAISTNGGGFTTLHIFSGSEGAIPYAGLISSGGALYGTTSEGGTMSAGTVFSFALPQPRLTIIQSASNVILTWPATATGLTLQSATNLSSAVWTVVSPAPAVVNGQNTVTNSIAGVARFYWLSQ